MCGIVGYVGNKEALPIVLDGLRRLEYRGYDSAGIAIMNGADVKVIRSAGKLENLVSLIDNGSPPKGRVGLGHTRWATHGKPSESNAHPHTDCLNDLALVHNGIVENYLPLKEKLLAEGHTMTSETDTEVMAHLIENGLKEGSSLEESVRGAFKEIKGSQALVVISKREPNKMVAVRLGNAGGLVIGIGDEEMYVASDMPALVNKTKKMLFLNDREMAVVTPGGVTFSTLDGTVVEKTPQTVAWDDLAASRGVYKHFTQKEIFEQPSSLTNVISGRVTLDPGAVNLTELAHLEDRLKQINKVEIIACGTAWHACLVAKRFIEDIAKVPAEVDYASEYRYRAPRARDDTLVIAITQSGETVDTLEAMQYAKRSGATLLALVNAAGSQATQIADGVVYYHAGPEIGVASTKCFTSQLVVSYLFALHLASLRGNISKEELTEHLWSLVKLPDLVAETLEASQQCERLANKYHRSQNFLFLGRGINYPIALEGALKLKEVSYIHAEGYPAGEMKHGPIALIDIDMPVVAIAVKDHLYDKMMSNIEQVKARDGIVIAIATKGDSDIAGKADHVIYIPEASEYINPILSVVPLQLLAYYTALRRGCDVDQPRNLAKSVTVE